MRAVPPIMRTLAVVTAYWSSRWSNSGIGVNKAVAWITKLALVVEISPGPPMRAVHNVVRKRATRITPTRVVGRSVLVSLRGTPIPGQYLMMPILEIHCMTRLSDNLSRRFLRQKLLRNILVRQKLARIILLRHEGLRNRLLRQEMLRVVLLRHELPRLLIFKLVLVLILVCNAQYR